MIELRYDDAAGTGFWRRDYLINSLMIEFFSSVFARRPNPHRNWWGYVLENDKASDQKTRWLRSELGQWKAHMWTESEMPGQLIFRLSEAEIPELLRRIEQMTQGTASTAQEH
jgi:hypothetical protein